MNNKYLTNSLSNINIGGKCKKIHYINSNSELIKCVMNCYENNEKFRVIGSGSNIYFVDNYDGVIIKNNYCSIIQTNYYPIKYETNQNNNDLFIVSSGTLLMDLVKYYKDKEYDISELAGIPGTVGGAVYNNAGAYGLEISDILIGANVIKNGKICYFSHEDFDFNYRNTCLKENHSNIVIISILFKSHVKRDKKSIQQNIDNILSIRSNKLPYEENNIGSVFKNIYLGNIKLSVASLLEQIEVKQMYHKDLQIYHKHSNIIINKGESNSTDMQVFINLIKERFLDKYGIELKTEIEIIS